MLTRVRLTRFKRFEDEVFDLTGQSVMLAGPNNSGKTTLLHAISAWSLALRRWQQESGDKSARTKRISVVLDEFTALPLREMNLLWLNRHVARKVPDAKTPKAAPIFIEVTAATEQGAQSLTMEFLYANEKLVYVRPLTDRDATATLTALPDFVRDFQVVHVPPFSGIGTQEPRHSTGIQSKLVGEGRAGEIVRNLILDIWERSGRSETSSPWTDLSTDLKRLFEYELLPPQFSDMQTYIVCEYRPASLGPGRQRGPRLDIANAGSGFHQVLLLLAFFYARPSSVLLLDEPDAHLHFILQREIFDHLRKVAQARGCKLIVATHAEVLLSGAEPDSIVSFVGSRPKRLITQHEKRALTDALKTLSSLDLLEASHVGAVLYVENESDSKLLREWANILDHPARAFLSFPYIWPLEGKGNLGGAKQHFRCLRLAYPEIKGLCILDRDQGQPISDDAPPGLQVVSWPRYEIENYLLNPDLLLKLVDQATNLFELTAVQPDREQILRAFSENFPSGIDWLGDAQVLRDLKASNFLVDTLSRTSRPLQKRDLYMLASLAAPAQVHRDVREMLDRIARILPAVVPALVSNASPEDANGTAEESSVTGNSED
jgi:predicted ATPase